LPGKPFLSPPTKPLSKYMNKTSKTRQIGTLQ
jgi:hypothetical protein